MTETPQEALNNPRRYNDPIIKDLVAFISASSFQSEFEGFFMRHCRTFTDDDEHKLEYHDIYLQFQSLFEVRIEEFCNVNSLGKVDFLRRCEQATEDDAKARHYVSCIF